MLLKLLLVLAALVALVLLTAALRPADFSVTRSTTIEAPASVIFTQVNTLPNWDAWSPWAQVDPHMRQTYSGPRAGVGAAFAWEGNARVGAGRMRVTESAPYQRIVLRLDFLKPFPGTNTTEFLFQPDGQRTRVTWTMSGKASFVPRLIGLFVSMDRMIRAEFSRGLGQLKAVAETKARG